MYINRAVIINIRSIDDLEIEFSKQNYAGWHVIIGDNGAGKSTVVKSIALALVGPLEAHALRQNWEDWLRRGEDVGVIRLDVEHDKQFDKKMGRGTTIKNYYIPAVLDIKKNERTSAIQLFPAPVTKKKSAESYLWGSGSGWFSASYGPFRRFSGGNKDYEKLYYSNPKLAPHLSVFGEDVALTECLDWLQTLHVKRLEKDPSNGYLKDIIKFINDGELLPHKAKLTKVNSNGVFFKDGNGCEVSVEEMSDGYRSVLSMTFEIIRQLVRVYGADKVFANIRKGEMFIDLPGVILIDEIDAHLHPTWQIRIGHWFLKYFPKIQFIVTTHSPLVCHAAEKGSVWHLAAPGSGMKSEQVEGEELKRLIYGNILEAYGTEMFGVDVTRSHHSQEKLKRLAQLNIKSIQGKLSAAEKKELKALKAIFPSIANTTDPEL